jgi:hypothetical protein
MLPYLQTSDPELNQLQTKWKSQLDPVLAQALAQGIVLKSVKIATGQTILNHLLGRVLQGFFLTDINGAATIYRSAPKNALTLTLTSNASVTADIFVF